MKPSRSATHLTELGLSPAAVHYQHSAVTSHTYSTAAATTVASPQQGQQAGARGSSPQAKRSLVICMVSLGKLVQQKATGTPR
jgi:hypothetical protein